MSAPEHAVAAMPEHTTAVDLVATGWLLVERIVLLPGVTRVVDAFTGFAHWLGEPAVQLVREGREVSASVTIGVDDRGSVGRTTEHVTAVLRSTLEEQGIGVGRVSVHVAPPG